MAAIRTGLFHGHGNDWVVNEFNKMHGGWWVIPHRALGVMGWRCAQNNRQLLLSGNYDLDTLSESPASTGLTGRAQIARPLNQCALIDIGRVRTRTIRSFTLTKAPSSSSA